MAAFATGWSANALCFPHRLHEAITAIEQAKSYRANEPDQASVILTLEIGRGLIQVALGDFKEAQKIATWVPIGNEAAKQAEMSYLGLEWLPSWTRLLAWLAWRKGQRSMADRLFRESLTTAEQRYSDDTLKLVPYLEDLAIYSMQLGRYRESEFFSNRIIEYVREYFPLRHPIVAIQSVPLGLLYANRKGYDQAEEIAKSALNGFARLGLRGCPREATAYFVMGIAALNTGRKELALDNFDEANKRLLDFNRNAMPLVKEIARCVALAKAGQPLIRGNFAWRRIGVGPQSFDRI